MTASNDMQRPDEPLLVLENVSTTFQRPDGASVRAVDGVSLTLGAARTLGIVGESGCGKSVLSRTIMQLLPSSATIGPDSTIRFDGLDVRNLPPSRRRSFWGVDIAIVFQDALAALNPTVRVGRQIAEPIRFHKGLDRKAARERAIELLRLVGVPEPGVRVRQFPHELSGGMRQRALIAVALSCEPRLLIADEPTTALDVTVQRQVLDLLTTLQNALGMAMILISHDLGVVTGRSEHVAVMYAGRVIEYGPTRAVFDDPRHPYTQALIRSAPRLENPPHTRLDAIDGRPPQLTGPRSACSFAPRCTRATSVCHSSDPEETIDPGTGRRWSCFHPVTSTDMAGSVTSKRVGV